MTSPQLLSRMKREIQMLEEEPPHGIYCWPSESNMRHLHAQIRGYEKTPYENGIFKLDIHIPDRYPFEPPHIQFKTPIYHPNVDNDGRICLDILKLPPKGSWKPSLNISTVLTSISVLMQDPNPDDPLLTEIADEYKSNYPLFVIKAKDYTKKYAITKIDNNALDSSNEENDKHGSNSSSESEINSKDEVSLFNPILMSTSKSVVSRNLSTKKSISLKKNKKSKEPEHNNNTSDKIKNTTTHIKNSISNLKTEKDSIQDDKNLNKTLSSTDVVESKDSGIKKQRTKKILDSKPKKQAESNSKVKKIQKKKKELEIIDLDNSDSESGQGEDDDKKNKNENELKKKDSILSSSFTSHKSNASSENNSENESQNIPREKITKINLSKPRKRLNLKKISHKESTDSSLEQSTQSTQEDKPVSFHRKRKLLLEEENPMSGEETHSHDSFSIASSPNLNTPKELFSLSQLNSFYDDFSKPSKTKLTLSMRKKRKN